MKDIIIILNIRSSKRDSESTEQSEIVNHGCWHSAPDYLTAVLSQFAKGGILKSYKRSILLIDTRSHGKRSINYFITQRTRNDDKQEVRLGSSCNYEQRRECF